MRRNVVMILLSISIAMTKAGRSIFSVWQIKRSAITKPYTLAGHQNKDTWRRENHPNSICLWINIHRQLSHTAKYKVKDYITTFYVYIFSFMRVSIKDFPPKICESIFRRHQGVKVLKSIGLSIARGQCINGLLHSKSRFATRSLCI